MDARRIRVAFVATLCLRACLCRDAGEPFFLRRVRLRHAPGGCHPASFVPPQVPHYGARKLVASALGGDKWRKKAEKSWRAPASTLKLTAAREEEAADGAFVPPVFAKDEGESSFIKNTLVDNVMFHSLPDEILSKLVLAFEKVEYGKGSEIIAQGDPNVDYFYVLRKGECTVTIDGKNLVYPYSRLAEGTVFGELGMLYDEPRAATVVAETDCTVYRADRETFRYSIGSQEPAKLKDLKEDLRAIDKVIDKIAGVDTRYSGSIIKQYKPQRSWLWRRWRGTVLQHSYKFTLFNMAVAGALDFFMGRRADCTWALAVSPDQSHPIIMRMAAFAKNWKYLQTISTFILTFFLSQGYSVWRQIYNQARTVQGRLNDIALLMATAGTRDKTGRYTPEANSLFNDVGHYMRLFHVFMWANFKNYYRVLSSKRGISRMLSRGLISQVEFDTLLEINQRCGPNNVCLEWIITRALKGMEDGGLRADDVATKLVLLEKTCELRGAMVAIGTTIDGKMPLAYTHIVQILVDSFLFMAPFALYSEVGIWSILSVGLLTLFYSGLLGLAKTFLDPLDNADYGNESINMDVGVLMRESNGGSLRWKNGAAVLPFSPSQNI